MINCNKWREFLKDFRSYYSAEAICKRLDKVIEDIALQRLRRELLFFGLDTYNMSDDEIKQRVAVVSKKLGNSGIEIKDALNGLRLMAKAINGQDKNTNQERI